MDPRKVILVADDDATLLDMIRFLLNSEGYEILSAADGKEALGVSRAHRGPIDLLLTDVSMPYVDGISAYRQISADRPDIKVLFMSGGVPGRLKLPFGLPFLSKPFVELDVLYAKVRDVLEVASLTEAQQLR
jgi:two-component system cell cycle sensor histidine kinase/response regulator CckA